MLIRAALVTFTLVGLGLAATPAIAGAAPYANCTDAKANGACNIPSSSPYYQPKLDRDHDGVGCEC